METSLTRLRHIVAVARTSSFSLAAEEEGISQPALSRSIQAFEAQYGVRLFDRGRGGVSLTPAGALVVEQARAMLASAGELDRSLRLYGKGEAGRVAVGFGPLMGSLLLPPLGKALLRARPNLQLVALVRPPDQLLEKLMDDSIEMIVGNNWQLADAPGVAQETLARLHLTIVARAGHPLAGRTVRMAEVSTYPVASAVDLPGSSVSGATGGVVCDNFHILREITAETDCIWVTSASFVATELRAGTLAELDVADLAVANTDICMAYRRGRTRSPAAVELTEQVRAMLAAMGPSAG